ncbi:hypothetical protein FOZ60_014386, partial [Perkinsus olseni]
VPGVAVKAVGSGSCAAVFSDGKALSNSPHPTDYRLGRGGREETVVRALTSPFRFPQRQAPPYGSSYGPLPPGLPQYIKDMIRAQVDLQIREYVQQQTIRLMEQQMYAGYDPRPPTAPQVGTLGEGGTPLLDMDKGIFAAAVAAAAKAIQESRGSVTDGLQPGGEHFRAPMQQQPRVGSPTPPLLAPMPSRATSKRELPGTNSFVESMNHQQQQPVKKNDATATAVGGGHPADGVGLAPYVPPNEESSDSSESLDTLIYDLNSKFEEEYPKFDEFVKPNTDAYHHRDMILKIMDALPEHIASHLWVMRFTTVDEVARQACIELATHPISPASENALGTSAPSADEDPFEEIAAPREEVAALTRYGGGNGQGLHRYGQAPTTGYGKFKHRPPGQKKWCTYHRVNAHWTSEYNAIKKLADDGEPIQAANTKDLPPNGGAATDSIAPSL